LKLFLRLHKINSSLTLSTHLFKINFDSPGTTYVLLIILLFYYVIFKSAKRYGFFLKYIERHIRWADGIYPTHTYDELLRFKDIFENVIFQGSFHIVYVSILTDILTIKRAQDAKTINVNKRVVQARIAASIVMASQSSNGIK